MSAVALPARAARPDRAAAERFLREAARDAAARRAVVVARVPAPDAPIEALAAALRKGTSMSWRPPVGPSVGAHGVAAMVRVRGHARFTQLGEKLDALFASLVVATHPDAPALTPRVYGGWSFAPGAADAAPWEGFGDGCFFLPRWSYTRGDRPSLALAIDRRDGWAGGEASIAAELGAIWAALEGGAPRAPSAPAARVEHLAPAQWAEAVDAIVAAIRRGELEKVVTARRSVVHASHDLTPWSVARQLKERYPDTWCFELRLGRASFLAATPERLFVKRGRSIEADALAGSIPLGAEIDAGADAELDPAIVLRASLKDHREHRPVVDHVLSRLRSSCARLEPVGEPRIRRLPNVLHLHSTIRGTLAEGVRAADLAAALHPTPAVGGVPVDAARAWITAHEAHPRGWYTGGVGWIDADGDAELTVPLRCGLVRGSTAWLWAGGGIVEGSEAEAEWRESACKLRPLLAALGAER